MEGSPYWSMKADQAVENLLDGLPEVAGSISVAARRIMAIAWLQGVQHGTEKTLEEMEVAAEKVKERAMEILRKGA